MSKLLIDVDDDALATAQELLGTATKRDTVNEALRRVRSDRAERYRRAISELGAINVESGTFDRSEAW